MYSLIKNNQVTVEPVTLAEAKEHLRLETDFTLDDTYISALISAARDRVENYCNRSFAVQDLTICYEGRGSSILSINLPFAEVATVNSVHWLDSEGVQTTLDPSEYSFVGNAKKVFIKSGYSFLPSKYYVDVTTKALAELPAIKSAILLIVGDLYENRSEQQAGVNLYLSKAVEFLLWPYRINLGL